MKISHLALVGFGNVGQGMTQYMIEHGDTLAERYGVRFQIVAVSDFKLGNVYDPDGLPLPELLMAAAQGDLRMIQNAGKDWPVEEMIDKVDADTLVEASFTNLETGEPALSYIQQALSRGLHVVTTNKGPVVLSFPKLQQLAKVNNVRLGIEGTVMSGTPALHLGRQVLAAAGISRIQGILNGTTNYILTKMEEGGSYQDALAEAQAQGYAEADPTGDVEGFDAAGKVVILCNLVMGIDITLDQVERQGIAGITLSDIQQASAEGKRWKLIGSIVRQGDRISASVRPTVLPLDHPLASVSGATNAVTFTTDILGDVTLVGPGAGRKETGYAIISDLLAIHGEHL